MKMLLTRLGENSRLAVTGDLSQIDLPIGVPSGLRHALDILDGTERLSFIRFGEADVVRNPLVTQLVRAYAQPEQALGLSRPAATGAPRRGGTVFHHEIGSGACRGSVCQYMSISVVAVTLSTN